MKLLLAAICMAVAIPAFHAQAQFFKQDEGNTTKRYIEVQYQPAFTATSKNTMSIQSLNDFFESYDGGSNTFDFSDNTLIAPTNVKRLGIEYSAAYFPGDFLDFEGILYASASKEYFSLLGSDIDISGGTLYSAGLGVAARYKFTDSLSLVAAVKAGMETPTSAWFRHQTLFETGSHLKIVKNILDDYYISGALEHWNKPELIWDPSDGRMNFDASVVDRDQFGFNFGIGYHF